MGAMRPHLPLLIALGPVLLLGCSSSAVWRPVPVSLIPAAPAPSQGKRPPSRRLLAPEKAEPGGDSDE